MDRLDSMILFEKLASTGSLSKAADALGLPLATASRRLADLEEHLGARLVIRNARVTHLTETGTEFLRACRRILDDLAVAERQAAGEFAEPRGQIVLTAPVVFGRLLVVPVLTEFLAEFREISVRLVLSDRSLPLLDDQIDAAVRIGPMPDSGLVATTLGEVRRVTCAAPRYLDQHGTPRTPEELSRHDCVSFDATVAGEWSFGKGAAARRIAITPRLSVTTAEAALDAAVAGLGITRVLSYQAAAPISAGRLRLILTEWEPDAWPVHLVTLGQGAAPKKLRAFLDFAGPRLRKRVAEAAERVGPHLPDGSVSR